MINQIQWKRTCCAWHGEYSEHTTPSGAVLRLKRGPSVDGYLVMVFKGNKCQTLGDDGVPEYKHIKESQLVELLQN